MWGGRVRSTVVTYRNEDATNGEERAMYDLNDYNERIQRHAQKTAAVEQHAWMKTQRTHRYFRVAAAKVLVMLATRIAPANEPVAPATTTFAEMHGA